VFRVKTGCSSIRATLSDFRTILSGNVGIMAISWFLFGISGSLTGPFFMLYAKSLGAQDFSIAVMRSIGMLAFAFSTIIGGILTDYIGRVKTIIIGTSIVTLTSFGYAFVKDWIQLSILWIIEQIAHFYAPALMAIIMDSLQQNTVFKGFLVLNTFSAIPGLFMPVIGGIMYDTYGLTGIRYAFVTSGIISTIVLILRIRFLRETLIVKNNGNNKFKSIILDVIKYRNVLKIVLAVYVYTSVIGPIVSAVSSTYGSIYVVEILKISKTELGLLSSIGTATSIILGVLIASSRSINNKLAITIASLSLTLSMALFTLPGYLNKFILELLVLSTIFGSLHGVLIGPLLSTIMTRILPVEIRGRLIGIQRMFESLGASLSAVYAGLLYVYFGPINSLLISTVTSIIVLPYLIFLYKFSGQSISQ